MRRKACARWAGRAATLVAGLSLAACATVEPHYAAGRGKPAPRAASGYKVGQPYQVGGIWYAPREQPDYDAVGVASWYGDEFQLKPTADGEIFDKDLPSAAHTTLPLPSMVEVTNLDNGRRLTVRVNDRGPFVGGRIIDLSHEAARQLGYDQKGLAHVRVRYLGPAPLTPSDNSLRYAQVSTPRRVTAATAAKRTAPMPTQVMLAFAAMPPPPASVAAQILPPPNPAPKPTEVATSSGPAAFRIQAGAFSDRSNAERAVGQLQACGQASIEPMARGGAVLYRVVLAGPADEAGAYVLRDRVAELGFRDARVLRPF